MVLLIKLDHVQGRADLVGWSSDKRGREGREGVTLTVERITAFLSCP